MCCIKSARLLTAAAFLDLFAIKLLPYGPKVADYTPSYCFQPIGKVITDLALSRLRAGAGLGPMNEA